MIASTEKACKKIAASIGAVDDDFVFSRTPSAPRSMAKADRGGWSSDGARVMAADAQHGRKHTLHASLARAQAL